MSECTTRTVSQFEDCLGIICCTEGRFLGTRLLINSSGSNDERSCNTDRYLVMKQPVHDEMHKLSQ